MTEKRLPEMLCSNAPNNVQASSFHRTAILNGQGIGKSAEQLAGSMHSARPCLYLELFDPSEQNLSLPHIFLTPSPPRLLPCLSF